MRTVIGDSTTACASATPVHTGRDRIVQAALREFADSGFDGASIRGIASRAGVSPALVQHHFGTKARLREECDQYVLAGVRVGQSEPGFAGHGPFTDLAAAWGRPTAIWRRSPSSSPCSSSRR